MNFKEAEDLESLEQEGVKLLDLSQDTVKKKQQQVHRLENRDQQTNMATSEEDLVN